MSPHGGLLGHPHRSAADLDEDAAPARPVLAEVHLRTMSWRCHRSSVSAVTIVATSRSACRPSRSARAASHRRSSSVRRWRRPPSCRRSRRFSSSKYDMASRSPRSTQALMATSQMRKADTSITSRRLYHGRGAQHVGRLVGHYGVRFQPPRPTVRVSETAMTSPLAARRLGSDTDWLQDAARD